MKRNFLKILSGFILVAISFNFGSALVSDAEKERINSVIIKIENRLESFSDKRKGIIYSSLKSRLGEKTTDKNSEIIEYILLKIEELENKTSQNIEVIATKTESVTPAESLETEETVFDTVATHNSVILRFTRGGSHFSVINTKKQSIANGNSVFIFRNGTTDLSIADIKTITSQLKTINPNVLIFIDQEGGLVNRYVDFESSVNVENIFSEEYVTSRMNIFSTSEKAIVRGLFPQNYGYFPSLGRIGVAYDSFVSDTSKKSFVEIIAYTRLKTLSDNGINTYGLVADLNLGNPAITNASRSFSKHASKYKILIDAFILASEETDTSLYLKHFPGHGAGQVDSHVGVLNLATKTDYLKKNMEVFEYFLDRKTHSGGLMVAHIVFNNSILEDFRRILGKADYILTDDLAMQGYKKMCSLTNQNNCINSDGIFSTFQTLWLENLIKVDTQYVESVY